MTGRTHDLAAFTSIVAAVSFYQMPPMSLATVLVSLGAAMIGGVMPDLDQPTANFGISFLLDQF